MANGVDYSASNAAVTSVFEGLQTELTHKYGNPRVRVSSFFPATISTKMFDGNDAAESLIIPILTPHQVAERRVQTLLGAERCDSLEHPCPHLIVQLYRMRDGNDASLYEFIATGEILALLDES
ncbi:hypothetical protein FE257_003916 [Aspergillus nanangensis]|uniref:Uncharacterized protein n=1 Tax=Aspergillus nanangensis TaxID=2582783 RepID=A0AAD4CRP2_ASPNN|nr:hypothetical protein FE257_003916 [Aspergillus nanangensis]